MRINIISLLLYLKNLNIKSMKTEEVELDGPMVGMWGSYDKTGKYTKVAKSKTMVRTKNPDLMAGIIEINQWSNNIMTNKDNWSPFVMNKAMSTMRGLLRRI